MPLVRECVISLFVLFAMTSSASSKQVPKSRCGCFSTSANNIARRICGFAFSSTSDSVVSSDQRSSPVTTATTIDELSTTFKMALQNHDTGLSPELVRACIGDSNKKILGACVDSEEMTIDNIGCVLLGYPQRPFYQEISKRLLQIFAFNQEQNGDDSTSCPLFINAADMGLGEELSSPAIPQPPSHCSTEPCNEWLRGAGDDGVLCLLGLRHTVGTERYLLPPDVSVLLNAARIPHRKTAPLHDNLTVAGRARCKHAHRGKDSFFGEVTGGTAAKNTAAEEVIRKILNEAAWINIHTFSGMDTPTIEVRVAAGYGARWTASWPAEGSAETSGGAHATNVVFRGFLEPQMEDGHLNRWRH